MKKSLKKEKSPKVGLYESKLQIERTCPDLHFTTELIISCIIVYVTNKKKRGKKDENKTSQTHVSLIICNILQTELHLDLPN